MHLPDPTVTRDVVCGIGEDRQKFPQCNMQSDGVCVLSFEGGGHYGQDAVDGLRKGQYAHEKISCLYSLFVQP